VNTFLHESPSVGPFWLVLCLIAGILALPIIRFFCRNKQNFWNLFMGFLFLLYVGGFFFVILVFLAIGSNVISILGILPKEYFSLDKHPLFWNAYFASGFCLWYLVCLVMTCKWARQKE
jgi:hypothetical protein